MRAFAFGMAVFLFSVSPSMAQDWGTYFNMATFGAGGGSDTNGWLNFECAGPDSGFSSSGEPFFSIVIGDRFRDEKQDLEPLITIRVDGGKTYAVPMAFDVKSTRVLKNDRRPEIFPEMQALIAGLRTGMQATAWSGTRQLAEVDLTGSFAALEYIAACIAGEE